MIYLDEDELGIENDSNDGNGANIQPVIDKDMQQHDSNSEHNLTYEEACCNSGSFSVEEDEAILNHVKEHGKTWLSLANKLNRSKTRIRQRYLTLTRKLEKNPNLRLEDIPRRPQDYLKTSQKQRHERMNKCLSKLEESGGIPTLRSVEFFLQNIERKAKENCEDNMASDVSVAHSLEDELDDDEVVDEQAVIRKIGKASPKKVYDRILKMIGIKKTLEDANCNNTTNNEELVENAAVNKEKTFAYSQKCPNMNELKDIKSKRPCLEGENATSSSPQHSFVKISNSELVNDLLQDLQMKQEKEYESDDEFIDFNDIVEEDISLHRKTKQEGTYEDSCLEEDPLKLTGITEPDLKKEQVREKS